MKKILILANNDIGLYNFRKELLETLVSLKYKVYISLPNGNKISELINLGCEFIETDVNRRGKNPLKDLKLLKKYKKIMSEIRPDCVLTYTIKPNVYGGMVAASLKIPYIANITGLGTALENPGPLQKITKLLYKKGLKKASCVFFQNAENKAFFEENKIGKFKKRLIPGSGVNLEKHSVCEYLNEDIIKFLFIGRIMKSKGIDELIEAIKKVKEKYNNATFDFLGGTENEEYLKLMKSEQNNGILKYHGVVNNVHEWIAESHCTILPSYHEGTANVLLESAAAARPVITTNVAGCKEIVEDGVTGFLCEVRNSQDLAEKIEKFINLSYEEKKQMGLLGRKKVEKEYDRNIVINAYMEEIKSIDMESV